MTLASSRQHALRWRMPLAVVAVAVLVRLVPATVAYGTSDVLTWELLGRLLLNGENFYATELHNWPALWIYFCAGMLLVHDSTGLPFSSLIKLPPIAADALISALLYRVALRRGWPTRQCVATGLAYALNPVSVLITGYHGQFDALMLAPTVLAWYVWESPRSLNVARATPPGTETDNASVADEGGVSITEIDGAPFTEVGGGVVTESTINPGHRQFDPRVPPPKVSASTAQESSSSFNMAEAPPRGTKGRNANPPSRGALARGEPPGDAPLHPRIDSSHHRLVASALALGLGIWFKPVPLLLLPILLARLATWRHRLLYASLAVAPAALGTLPYFLLWPQDVAANFLGYSSWFGQWGYPVVWMLVEYVQNGTIPWWLPDPTQVSAVLRAMYLAGKWVLLVALAGTWWLIDRRGMDVPRSIVATFSVFYFVSTGFGVQYLLWIVPFAVLRRDRWLWPFTIAATGLLVVAYTFGLAYQTLPVNPDNGPSLREFIVKLATLPTWFLCCLWAWSVLRPTIGRAPKPTHVH